MYNIYLHKRRQCKNFTKITSNCKCLKIAAKSHSLVRYALDIVKHPKNFLRVFKEKHLIRNLNYFRFNIIIRVPFYKETVIHKSFASQRFCSELLATEIINIRYRNLENLFLLISIDLYVLFKVVRPLIKSKVSL